MDYNAQYQAYLNTAETALAQQADRCFNERSRVCEAARYSLFGGGKRVRAVLCLAVCDMLNGNRNAAACYAAGVEMLHCYSLIHDDLPCMDNDDMRRGRPSCHKAFGEATALLAGDTLLTAAFETLSGSPGTAVQNTAAVCALSRAAGANGMVWGQELDLAFEEKPATAEELREGAPQQDRNAHQRGGAAGSGGGKCGRYSAAGHCAICLFRRTGVPDH